MSKRQLLVTQFWNVPVGFFSLSKCNGCLTSGAFGVQEVSQTTSLSNPTPSFFPLVSHRRLPSRSKQGSPVRYPTPPKKKRRSHYTTVSRTSSRLELLTCEFRASRLICFSFYLQSEQDGIFGEGLFFLRLNNAWNNSSVSITPRQTHTHTLRPLLPLVTGKDVDVEALVRGILKQFYWWWWWFW